jgi:hypothetical protein
MGLGRYLAERLTGGGETFFERIGVEEIGKQGWKNEWDELDERDEGSCGNSFAAVKHGVCEAGIRRKESITGCRSSSCMLESSNRVSRRSSAKRKSQFGSTPR